MIEELQILIKSLQVSHGIDWVSSTIFFPTITSSMPRAFYVPVPRVRFRPDIECKHLDTTPRQHPLNVVIEQMPNQYHLFKIDLSEERYQHDIVKAIKMLYSNYRSWHRNLFSFRAFAGMEYVKVTISCLEKTLSSC